MRRVVAAVLGSALVFVLGPAEARAGTCTSTGCHKGIVAMKFLHGPVAAEEAGGEGCVSCHILSGASCTSSKAGQFAFKTKKERLCLLCHERGTATQHTKNRTDCLSCHSPHGSEQSKNHLRAGKAQSSKTKP